MKVVILGLSITSSWGNGHATTYRGLVRELCERGHEVIFLERDQEWYASNRDLPKPPFGKTILYLSVPELQGEFGALLKSADVVVIGSYVPEGRRIGEWITKQRDGATVFYDIDTPVTLANLARGDLDYLSRELIGRFDLYLSFTGGPTLDLLEQEFGSPMARPLYCSVDPALYYPEALERGWDLGYMGTYSPDRQPALERLMLAPARQWRHGRFIVAGPQFPPEIQWPRNVKRITHLSPREHRDFYNAQRFTLNITRADMVAAGYSPSVRLFEAAACGTPVISDSWNGLEEFLRPGEEILITRTEADTLGFLRDLSESERLEIGRRARERVLRAHTAAHRAQEFESYVQELIGRSDSGPV
jgi:spore maturation protein CgeB